MLPYVRRAQYSAGLCLSFFVLTWGLIFTLPSHAAEKCLALKAVFEDSRSSPGNFLAECLLEIHEKQNEILASMSGIPEIYAEKSEVQSERRLLGPWRINPCSEITLNANGTNEYPAFDIHSAAVLIGNFRIRTEFERSKNGDNAVADFGLDYEKQIASNTVKLRFFPTFHYTNDANRPPLGCENSLVVNSRNYLDFFIVSAMPK
ncbi:MAG: hypothetical protein AAFQ58_05120 [Pseudomonadota bacterium]